MLKLGVIADAHLCPEGAEVWGSQNDHVTKDPEEGYRLALDLCAREGVDAVVLLGDLSQSGDDESLERGLKLAAETGLATWAVSGNHDCFERTGTLESATRRLGAENVRLATLAGEPTGEGLRVAGAGVASGDWGYAAGGTPNAHAWGDEPALWLAHYPILSFVDEVHEAGFVYGDDLEDREEIARPLLERQAPTVVVNGHLHLRDAQTRGGVLQLSCAALVEPPFEVTLVELGFEEESFFVRRRSGPVLPMPDGVQIPALSPAREEWVFEGGAWHAVVGAAVR